MYLLLFNRTIFEDNSENIYRLKGRFFEECRDQVEALYNRIAVDLEPVNKILFYAGGENFNNLKAKEVDFKSIHLENNVLSIEYENVVEIKEANDAVRRHAFGYLRNNDLLPKDNRLSSITIIEKEEDYNYVKGLRVGFDNKEFYEKVAELKKNGNQEGIVELFKELGDIENHPVWKNHYLLYELSRAISTLLEQEDKGNMKEEYFLKVNDRVLEIKPDFNPALNQRAYFHANKYRETKYPQEYKLAVKFYERLIKETDHKYKEKFRLARLNQEYIEFENNDSPEIRGIIESTINLYKELVLDYDLLTDEYKEQYKDFYSRSIYSYITLKRKYKSNYWEEYVNAILEEREFNPKLLTSDAIEDLKFDDKILNIYENAANLNSFGLSAVQRRPSAFDIFGIHAEVKQDLGLIYFLKDDEIYQDYFEESSDMIEDKVLGKAKKLMETDPGKFAYPHFAKLTQAINYYMLGEVKNAHRLFRNAKSNMKIEEAKLYMIDEEFVAAVDCLSEITPEDPCYDEASKLLERFSK